MDEIGDKGKQKMNNYQTTLKKVTKLLFSLSLFSFMFSQLPYSWLFHYSSSSSTLCFHNLFNQPIDKNFMFVLCNGLLVFLANYSGLLKTLSTSRRNYDSFKVYDQFGPLSYPIMLEAQKPSIERDDAELEQRIISVRESRDDDDDDEEDDYGLRASFFAAERAEVDDTTTDEEGNYGSGVLSDEELNRKFDEFIKRMKEEIIVDARRTLVVV